MTLMWTEPPALEIGSECEARHDEPAAGDRPLVRSTATVLADLSTRPTDLRERSGNLPAPDPRGPYGDRHPSSADWRIEREVVTEAEAIELLRGFTIRVARTRHLIALKILSRDDITRPQDIADLRALLRVASDDDLLRARELLELISARGYNRGRDLAADFRQLLHTSR